MLRMTRGREIIARFMNFYDVLYLFILTAAILKLHGMDGGRLHSS